MLEMVKYSVYGRCEPRGVKYSVYAVNRSECSVKHNAVNARLGMVKYSVYARCEPL